MSEALKEARKQLAIISDTIGNEISQDDKAWWPAFDAMDKLEAALSRSAEATLTEAFQATERRLGRSVDVADFTLGWQEALKDAREKWIGDEWRAARMSMGERDAFDAGWNAREAASSRPAPDTAQIDTRDGVLRIADERKRQIEKEGWY